MNSYVSAATALLLTVLGSYPAAQAQNMDLWAQLRENQVAKLQALTGTYEGQIGGKYAIRLQLNPGTADTLITGLYYYVSKGQPLVLNGFTRASTPTQALELREMVPTNAEATGWFTIGLNSGNEPQLLGQWYNASGTTLLPVKLWRIGGAARLAGLVAHVTPKTYLNSFRVPVVTVPDAGVTRLLAHWFSLQNLTGNDVAGLRGELEWHSGIQEADFTTNYNARGLLSLSVQKEGLGASVWHDIQTYNLDLVTGFPIRLADELRPERVLQFLALGQRKLSAIAREYVPTQQDFLSAEDKAGVLSQTFSLGSTNEYTIGPDGVVFDHAVAYDDLSNYVSKTLAGNFQVRFTYAELEPFLRPDSPLRRLL